MIIKSAIFISLDGKVTVRMCKQLLRYVLQDFTYVYIIDNPKITPILESFSNKEKLKLLHLECNSLNREDPNSLYIIKKIKPCIHVYSLRLAINVDEELWRQEKAYNIHVDYLSIVHGVDFSENLNQVLVIKEQFMKRVSPLNYRKSVLVFDLDDTIVDKDGTLVFHNVAKVIRSLRDVFDYVILWSHGSYGHVNNALLLTLRDVEFDTIIAMTENDKDQDDDYSRNKGVGKMFRIMNNEHGVGELKYSALVDDQAGNFIGDYDMFLHIPNLEDNSTREAQVVAMFAKLKSFIHAGLKTTHQNNSFSHMLHDKY